MSKIENILLLSVEDLNDWISPLGGHPDAYTPNMARLAKRAFSFEAAYAASPACSPSRTATLFGQGPWRNGIYGNEQSWNMAYPEGKRLSIAGRAREAGWRTVMAGKVYHEGKSGQDPEDWDVMHPRANEEFPPVSRAAKEGRFRSSDDFGPTEAGRISDDAFCDAMIAEMKAGATKQFWAHGIYRPHLPFIVPKRFFELIPDPPRLPRAFGNRAFDAEDDSELLPLPRHAGSMSRRWTGRVLQETGEYTDFVRAYLASIAYADHLVGRLLDHLDETGLSASTLVVLWSDHGWQFGEKLAFRKFSLWERSLRVPLMVAGPGIMPGKTQEPVSLLDIYPTLLDVIGGEAPHELDGQSLWPIMRGMAGRGYAVSSFRVPNKKAPHRPRISMSVRTEEHRLIKYFDGTGEFYFHRDDPFERKTLVSGFVKLRDQDLPKEARELMRRIPDTVLPKTEKDLPPHKRRWRGPGGSKPVSQKAV